MTNSIKQKSGNDCVNCLAGRDIYYGIPEDDLDKKIEEKVKAESTPIKDKLIKLQSQVIDLNNNIITLSNSAEEKFNYRCKNFGKNFILKLLNYDSVTKEKILNSFEEPDMCYSFKKAQTSYALNENNFEILTNMLINRGQISVKNNKQMLIDDAIDILPRLTQKHLDILSFYVDFVSVRYEVGNNDLFSKRINLLISKFKKIYPLDTNSLQYLQQKMCLNRFSSLEGLKNPEEIIANRTQLLTNGIDLSEFSKLIPGNLKGLVSETFINPTKFAFMFSEKNNLENFLKSKGVFCNIDKLWQNNYNYPAVKNYLLSNYPDIKIIFDSWTILKQYNTTLLGNMIAVSYIKATENIDINWDFK